MLNIFQFLATKKSKEVPVRLKLLNNLPLKEKELIIDIDSDCKFFRRSDLLSLPDNLTVYGNLIISYTKITKLPKNLTVHGYLDISNTKIKSLPKSLVVHDDLFCEYTPLAVKMQNQLVEENYSKLVKGKIHNYPF